MRLTEQQLVQMRAKGLTTQQIETLAAERGYQMPDRRDVLQKTTDIVNKIFPGKQVGQAIGTLAGYGIEKAKPLFGGQDNSQYYDLSAPTPLQVTGDVVRGAATIAGARLPAASSILGKTAQFGALGGVAGGASGIAEGKSFGESAGQAVRSAAIGALTGFTFGVVEKAIRGIGQGIGATGQKIQTTVIQPSQADIKDGFSVQTLRKYNLGGSLQDTMNKTDQQLDDLTRELNKKLASSNTSINVNNVYDNTVKRLFGDRLTGFGSNTQLSTAAEKLREEIVYSTGPNGLASVPEAQILKRAAGHYGAWQYGYQDPSAKASERVYNIFYNEMKKEIERASPAGVKEINKKMSELIPVMNAVIRRIPVDARNRGLSLTDIITLTGASIDSRSLVLTGMNFAQKSGKVGNVLSKATGAGAAVARGVGALEQTAQTMFPSTR